MSSAISNLDPYVLKSENTNLTLKEKITDLHGIIKSVNTAMLTTHSADGHLHSRAMTPCPLHNDSQLSLIFIANNASHKFDELQNDSHVNVSFYSMSNTSWASYAGIAQVSQDRDLIKKNWSSMISAYFGDLKDGIHKGDENDPRISVIEVVPDEIRYFLATTGSVGRTVSAAVGAMTGHVSTPGELRTITKVEASLVDQVLGPPRFDNFIQQKDCIE